MHTYVSGDLDESRGAALQLRRRRADTNVMTDLTATRWTRYGKDRVYVKTSDGAAVGHIDLVTGQRVLTAPEFEAEFDDLARGWQDTVAKSGVSIPLSPPAAVVCDTSSSEPVVVTTCTMTAPPVQIKPLPPEATPAPERDLAGNRAGMAAKAKRDEVNAQAPVLNLVARVFGVKTPERAWRVGAKGEKKVGRELNRLPTGWHVLHAVPVGEHGSDIDHVVIGPAGVFTLNAKCHPGGKATVYEHKLYVNGCATDYLRNSRFEGRRAGKLLSAACGLPISVTPAIVFVDLDTFTVKATPSDVAVTTRMRLVGWMTGLPVALDSTQVDLALTHARIPSTWT